VLLSPAGFARWTAVEPFRRFVFGLFADRLADLMALAEAVAFQRLDQRLATRCWATARWCTPPTRCPGRRAGHRARDRHAPAQALRALGLGAALSRERISIVDAAALRALAGAV
jgi:CRP/FNR family transcriptional regulator